MILFWEYLYSLLCHNQIFLSVVSRQIEAVGVICWETDMKKIDWANYFLPLKYCKEEEDLKQKV